LDSSSTRDLSAGVRSGARLIAHDIRSVYCSLDQPCSMVRLSQGRIESAAEK